jgi:alkanesulfonate monooxygenase SsuD/methylene tetrahydromethanopterin reductase-like flavin-dependent oxidoreductase (luciferase family)
MRVGATIFNQNYTDWQRYEAEEHGESVASRPARSDREIFNEEIGLARLAEDTGFDSVWTIEHHFTPYTMVTNPLQYLTYIAGITRRVDLGTMVVVLPWHNPIRVAEDVNMLDAFLGPNRNVICGVGRGLGRREYQGLGVDQNEARQRFDESVQLLSKILSTGECREFEGNHFKVKDLRLRPQLERDLSQNLWCAGGTEQTVEVIARNGVRPLVIPTTTLDAALANLKRYAQLRREAGFEPTHCKLALWTYVAETEAEARAGAERYMVEYADSTLRHYELTGGHLANLKGYEHYAKMANVLKDNDADYRTSWFHSHPWGTPEKVIARVKELAEAFGTNEIMFIFKYGSMPQGEAEKNMRLFAKEVIPALRALDPAPLGATA